MSSLFGVNPCHFLSNSQVQLQLFSVDCRKSNLLKLLQGIGHYCQRMGSAQTQRFGLESKALKCFELLGLLVFCEFIRSRFSEAPVVYAGKAFMP